MLHRQDAVRQRVARVVVEHRNRALQDDWSAVELGRHEVDGHATHLYPVLNRLMLGIHAGKGRQKGRMNIQNPIGERVEQHATNRGACSLLDKPARHHAPSAHEESQHRSRLVSPILDGP